MIYQSKSARKTQQIAGKMAYEFSGSNKVFALSGELGSGKTIFVQGFARTLGIKEKIISPTFVIIKQHLVPGTDWMLYHIDLYRLEEKVNIKELGLDEIFQNPNNIILIEWAEKILDYLPKETIFLNFKKIDETREIEIIFPKKSI